MKPTNDSHVETSAPLTKAERQKQGKPLFVLKDDLDEQIAKLEEKTEGLRKERRAVAARMFALLGQGPFTWKGRKVILMRRVDKMTGEETCYFRGESERVAEVIG